MGGRTKAAEKQNCAAYFHIHYLPDIISLQQGWKNPIKLEESVLGEKQQAIAKVRKEASSEESMSKEFIQAFFLSPNYYNFFIHY